LEPKRVTGSANCSTVSRVERYRWSVPEHVTSFACPRLPSSRGGTEVCR